MFIFVLLFVFTLTVAGFHMKEPGLKQQENEKKRSQDINILHATEELKTIRRSLHEKSTNSIVDSLPMALRLNQLVPKNLEPIPDDLTDSQGSSVTEQAVKNYTVSFVEITDDLLKLEFIDVWKRKSFTESEAVLSPAALLHTMEDVFDYFVENVAKPANSSSDRNKPNVLYESPQIEINIRTVDTKDSSISINLPADQTEPNPENMFPVDSDWTGDTDLTVISSKYKTFPAILHALTETFITAKPKNNGTAASPKSKASSSYSSQSAKGSCELHGFSLTTSLCKFLYNASPSQSDALKFYWSFPPGSSVLSITAYKKHKKQSAPVNFRITSNRSSNQTNSKQTERMQPILHKCVFHDEKLNLWSDHGCVVLSVQNGTPTCHCNHTTNFAVLILLPNDDGKKKLETFTTDTSSSCFRLIQVLSYSADAFSAVILTVCVVFFACSRRKLQTRFEMIDTHLCLALSMLLLHAFLLMDEILSGLLTLGSSRKPIWLCTFFAFAIHYFLLCNFAWMTVEGIVLYIYVVKSNLQRQTMKIWRHIIGWALPGFIALSTLTIGGTIANPYLLAQTNVNVWRDDSKRSNICTLSQKLAWAVLVPAVVSLTINVVIMMLVLRLIGRLTRRSQFFKPFDQRLDENRVIVGAAKKAVMAFCKLSPVLGIFWILGFVAVLAPSQSYCALQVVHCIANGMQGFFLFIVTILQNEENRTALISQLMRLCSTAQSLVSGLGTSRRSASSSQQTTATIGPITSPAKSTLSAL